MNHDAKVSVPQLAWSPEVRTWVSLLLIVHLFAVVVAVTTYTRPSGVQEQLHALFAPYLRELHLAVLPVTYPFARYHLTHATPSDVDFSCEVDIKGPGGSVETFTIPDVSMQPGVRFRRYQAMINAMGSLAEGEENEEVASLLPKAIASSILKQHDAQQGVIRCRAHVPPAMEDMGGTGPKLREALENYRTLYEAQVFSSAGSVEILKKATTLEVAPVEGAPKP